MGLSVREVAPVLDLLGIDRSHGAIWNWTQNLSEDQSDPTPVQSSRVAGDEEQIEVHGEKKCCTPRLTRNRTFCWKSMSSAVPRTLRVLVCERDAVRLVNAAELIQRRRFSIG